MIGSLTGRGPRGRSLRGLRRGLFVGTTTKHFVTLAGVVLVLNFFGTLMIISSSSVESVRQTTTSPWHFATQQLMWTGFGIVAMVFALSFSARMWRRLAVPLHVLSILLLVAVLLPGIGISRNGATRWIGVGPVGFQPSELAKLSTVVILAEILTRQARHVDDWRRTLGPALVMILPIVALVMRQPNLGTTLIILLGAAGVVTISGIRARFLGAIGLGAALLALVAIVVTPFRQRRLDVFLDLRGNLENAGYQNAQAMVGFANGGWLGRGIGRSTVKWGYLPYPYNDFIFAVIGEELGLLGTILLVALFVAFVCLGISVAARAKDHFSMLLAAGITTWIGGQAFLNMASVTNLVPSTGVPLPFISFGGSAQMVNLLAVGILLNIARHPHPEEPPDPGAEVAPVRDRLEVVA